MSMYLYARVAIRPISAVSTRCRSPLSWRCPCCQLQPRHAELQNFA